MELDKIKCDILFHFSSSVYFLFKIIHVLLLASGFFIFFVFPGHSSSFLFNFYILYYIILLLFFSPTLHSCPHMLLYVNFYLWVVSLTGRRECGRRLSAFCLRAMIAEIPYYDTGRDIYFCKVGVFVSSTPNLCWQSLLFLFCCASLSCCNR